MCACVSAYFRYNGRMPDVWYNLTSKVYKVRLCSSCCFCWKAQLVLRFPPPDFVWHNTTTTASIYIPVEAPRRPPNLMGAAFWRNFVFHLSLCTRCASMRRRSLGRRMGVEKFKTLLWLSISFIINPQWCPPAGCVSTEVLAYMCPCLYVCGRSFKIRKGAKL